MSKKLVTVGENSSTVGQNIMLQNEKDLRIGGRHQESCAHMGSMY